MENVFQRKFSASEVASVAGITASTLQNWLKREVISGHKKDIEGGGSQGRHRRFSFFSLIDIAKAAALVRGGISDLPTAFKASRDFAHFEPGGLPGILARRPAVAFHASHGRTLLVVSGERSEVFRYAPGEDVIARIRAKLRDAESFTVVDMTDLFQRVCADIGASHSEVLDEVYGG